MKKAKFLILFGLLLCTVSFFGACQSNKSALSTPVNLQIDSDTLMLTWRESTDALRYQVDISGSVKDTRKNSYSLRSLSEGEYTIRVRAIAKSNGSKSNSAWSEAISFTREHESGMVYTLTADRKAYELTSLGTAKGNVEIPATYRGKPVIGIGKRAFISKVDLTGCVIGPNVTSIGEQAFSRSSLTSVTFPTGLKTIGARAFEGCKALTGPITLPDTLTDLGASAFNDCEQLQGVKIGNGLQILNENAFSDCDALTDITFGDSLLVIGPKAFANCRSLQSVKIGNKVQIIYDAAFYLCPNLGTVTFNDKLLYIGAEAFARCNKLASIDIPDTVQYIGDRCFYTNPIALNREDYATEEEYNEAVAAAVMALPLAPDQIKLGTGVQQMGQDAFTYTQAWYRSANVVSIDGWIVGVKNRETVFSVVPADIEGARGIADYAYAKCEKMESCALPNTVQYVGTGAFMQCTGLAQCVLGSGLKVLGEGAFYECTSLATVILGSRNGAGLLGESSLTRIGAQAFSGCANLDKISIPKSVTGIGHNAFKGTGLYTTEPVVYVGDTTGAEARWLVGCNNALLAEVHVEAGTVGIADYAFYGEMVVEVELPNSVKYIGRSAFYESFVMEATLPEGITEIGDYAFYGCAYLGKVNIPSTVTKIGRSAFHMTSLESLTIPAAVQEIGDYAFYGNTFTELTFENNSNLKKIGEYAFYGCNQLTSLELPDSLENMGEYAFKKCAALTTVKIGSGLTAVPKQAFGECENLTTVTVSPGVRKIGDYAFYKTAKLENLSLGTVSEIGDYAFYGCAALRTLTLPSSLSAIGKQAFRNCSSLVSIVVPQGTALGDHAFYGVALTYYIEADAPSEAWGTRWNSAYRAAVFGVTLSEDKSYVVSITTGENITGVNEKVPLTAPVRSGYTFGGWTTVPGGAAEYQQDEIASLSAGTTLYAVWTPVV